MMKEKEIIGMFERYLEGQTSLDEERRLRRALTKTDSMHPSVVEAKALFAYLGMAANPEKQPSKPRWRIGGLQIAASIVVIIAVGIAFFRFSHADSGCYTMIACVEDTSADSAFSLIGSQLQAIGEASDEVTSDLFESISLIPD